MSVADEIDKLNQLKESGALTEEEFQQGKAALLARERPTGEKVKELMGEVSSDANFWGILIHLSQFLGYLFPFAGYVLPIVLWQIKKKDSPLIDRHGRVVVNWILSALIYGFVSGLLIFVGIGIPMLILLAVLAVVFPIVGAIKANDGEAWPYPMSIHFFSLD